MKFHFTRVEKKKEKEREREKEENLIAKKGVGQHPIEWIIVIQVCRYRDITFGVRNRGESVGHVQTSVDGRQKDFRPKFAHL